MDVPNFSDLPPVEGMPNGCAWGVFDQDSKKDVLGTLNRLTPSVVKAAAAEVKDGVSVSLNWPLNALDNFPTGRRNLSHTPFSIVGGKGFDDELTLNTQSSSQWDSLVHWQHQDSGLAYNSHRPTVEGLSRRSTADTGAPTLDHWHARGGMVSRGVLVDFKEYVLQGKIAFHPLGGYRITIEEIEAVARRQGVEFRPGDVEVLRTGATDVLATVECPEMPLEMAKMPVIVSGVDGTVDSARWFWDKKFSAVAGDALAVEAAIWECAEKAGSLVLHEYFLALFGMPIGELWDLDRLAEHCKRSGRYTFMLTSSPLNVPGLVGSPPNALAIF